MAYSHRPFPDPTPPASEVGDGSEHEDCVGCKMILEREMWKYEHQHNNYGESFSSGTADYWDGTDGMETCRNMGHGLKAACHLTSTSTSTSTSNSNFHPIPTALTVHSL